MTESRYQFFHLGGPLLTFSRAQMVHEQSDKGRGLGMLGGFPDVTGDAMHFAHHPIQVFDKGLIALGAAEARRFLVL